MSSAERKVILWPDTFNNYFFPDTAKAAYRVLDAAGFRVEVPQQSVCCGRPLYDYGMLGQAKKQLTEILDIFREDIRDGTPIVVLEPSCLAVFRDELTNLWPHDRDAQRLSAQTMTLAEALQRYAPEFEPMRLAGDVLLHGHCHQKSLVGMKQEEAMLDRLGFDHTLLDDGCCGMAGSFGFEAGERYEVSMAVGERGILPAVRKARPDTLIVADGFSCREQISQGTRRRALHLAEVLERAIPEPGDSTRR
jgi:Fe-S oxidoreductase